MVKITLIQFLDKFEVKIFNQHWGTVKLKYFQNILKFKIKPSIFGYFENICKKMFLSQILHLSAEKPWILCMKSFIKFYSMRKIFSSIYIKRFIFTNIKGEKEKFLANNFFFVFSISWSNFVQILWFWTFFNSQYDGLLKNVQDDIIWVIFDWVI